jgi:Asp-tRNA(Asn)/Glu-tRNA(Gln) amidotransferase A subunit family amidase
MQLMAVEGVMARSVADVRLGLAIVAGAHPRDPESVPVLLDVPRSSSRRVALLAEPPGGDTHPEIAAAVRRAGDALADAGYDVVESAPPLYEQALDVWGRFLFTDIRAQEAILRRVMGPDATRFLDLIGTLYPEQDTAGLVSTLAECLGAVRDRAPADPEPDLDAAAVPARLGRRQRGAGARDDAADAPGHAGESPGSPRRRGARRYGRRTAGRRAGAAAG